FLQLILPPLRSPFFPYTTLFRSVPVVELAESPLVRGVSPVRIRYRECGRGVPLVFLHGGWGYEIYSLDRQLARLAARHRIIIPEDRKSTRLNSSHVSISYAVFCL